MMADDQEDNIADFLPDSPTPEIQAERLFSIHYHETGNRITIALNPGFSIQDWETFMAFVRHKIGQKVLNWDLDLRRIPCLSSMLLGAMVTLNMVIRSQRGDLRLIVAKGSRVAQLFVLSKLNRIITMMEL
jgi:anti-anti-sigma regulatory factor